MNNFKTRSFQKELLDSENVPFEDIALNMKELNFINTFLGGHKISIDGCKKLISTSSSQTFSVCEVGCGGGDNMQAIQSFAIKKNININWIGIDLNQYCIDYAKKTNKQLNAHWIINNYKKVTFENKPDIIFCSLFTHHLNGEELIEFLQWCKKNAKLGFFINDLQRNPIAFWSIKILTLFFSNSYLVQHDAPLSVKRGFLKKEWNAVLSQLDFNNFSVKWKWAFRHLIIVNNEL
jgi:2-polyprenyl-3-methyl-5-hydroxy-6-metoxy-1,4-benzoquinol methylase